MHAQLAILGRQAHLSIAELESLVGSDNIKATSPTTALFSHGDIDIQSIGGSLKIGTVSLDINSANWEKVNKKVVQHYLHKWKTREGKITLGISAYDWSVTPKQLQRLGLILKSNLKSSGVSMRLVPNNDSALNTATSHHNKLGLSENKVELLIVKIDQNRVIVAESNGAQNITALAARDQARPKTDAFVGMLPPKLALMMVNMARPAAGGRVLDPFCGTGVVLQEAALLGYPTYGTDLSEKMIDYSRANLEWLREKAPNIPDFSVALGDAMDYTWEQPIGSVVCETYLGQPFSAPPSPAKLKEVVRLCNHISSKFLENLHQQLSPGTRLCVALPAWRSTSGDFTHLPLIRSVESLGYQHDKHQHAKSNLLYYREDQVVAREIIVLERI